MFLNALLPSELPFPTYGHGSAASLQLTVVYLIEHAIVHTFPPGADKLTMSPLFAWLMFLE